VHSLPTDFIQNIEHSHKEGKAWLQALPSLLSEAAQRWRLTLGEPFLLSFNYVCAARDATGLEVVLKAGVPNPELTSEIEALRLYDGRAAVRLIDSDADQGLLLLERLRPGTMLLTVDNDAQATEIAAGVMRSLWRPAPQQNNLILLQNWFDNAFGQYRQRFGANGPLPSSLLHMAESLVADFFAEQASHVVLHGDFHHYNLLKSGANWKVIDPKGVIGPRGYEVGPLLVNPLGNFLHGTDAKQITERRIAILAEQLGMDRSHICGWAIAHAVLSACWSFDERGRGGEHALHCADVLIRIR